MFLLNCFIFFQIAFQKLTIFADSISKTTNFESATIGVSVRNCTTNEVIYELNSKKAVNPASTLKLISTGLALNELGRDFKFSTKLEYDGYIENGVLKGNIYLTGSGDPSFGSKRYGSNLDFVLEEIYFKIKQLGISKIEGRIIGDGSIYSKNATPDSWIWGDLGNYYGASATGLNLAENELKINFKTNNSLGSNAEIASIYPDLNYFNFNNEVFINPKGTGDQTLFYTSPLSNDFKLTGSVPQNNGNFEVKGSILNPEFAIAFLIEKRLSKDSILFTQKAISKADLPYQTYNQRFLIAEFQSPPLYQLIQSTNFESLNLYAEAFAKAISFQSTKDSSPNGVAKYLKMAAQNKGIDVNGFNPKDGSGLSPSGFVTANFMTDFLQKMTFESNFNDYLNSIPTVGVSGTVKNLCKNSKAVGNIQAKSGSIEGTRAYSGYFMKNGQRHSFAFIINQYEDSKNVRQVLEKMMILLFED
jgi:serine-type D-Ala-D-Ala carboxypeptidase/endopeptidase (penicillin-binding protein 4)